MSHHEQYDLEDEIRQLEVQALNFAARFTKDAHARQQYTRATRNFVRELRAAHAAGWITAAKAAETAHQMRNEVMEKMRRASSDVGEAMARAKKPVGPPLKHFLSKYA